MATPESIVKNKVKKVLKEAEAYQFWPVQMGYGAATIDCIGCHEGRFFGIETKAPGKHPTARQRLTIESQQEAGAMVFVIGEAEVITASGMKSYSGIEELEEWLNNPPERAY